MIKIAIFISGKGSNAENIIKYFQKTSKSIKFILLSNNKKSNIVNISQKYKVNYYIFSNKELFDSNKVLNILQNNQINLIVLAGFLVKIPLNIINNFRKKILNIHPSLLPKYGGKGMYGDFVHKKVLENKEKLSGITIHFVNQNYDEGDIIFQKHTYINPDYDLEKLRKSIQSLEYKYYPIIIDKMIN